MVHNGGGQLGERAAGVFKYRGAEVLHFGIVVRHVGHHRHHLGREAQHPLNGVDVVNRVVKGAAAPLFFPGAAPPQVVVAVSAPPERIHLGMTDLAGKTGIQRRFQTPEGVGKAVLGNDGEDFATGLLCGDHRVALLQRGGHRFFAQHMATGIEGINADLCMDVGRGADIHDVDLRL